MHACTDSISAVDRHRPSSQLLLATKASELDGRPHQSDKPAQRQTQHSDRLSRPQFIQQLQSILCKVVTASASSQVAWWWQQ